MSLPMWIHFRLPFLEFNWIDRYLYILTFLIESNFRIVRWTFFLLLQLWHLLVVSQFENWCRFICKNITQNLLSIQWALYVCTFESMWLDVHKILWFLFDKRLIASKKLHTQFDSWLNLHESHKHHVDIILI